MNWNIRKKPDISALEASGFSDILSSLLVLRGVNTLTDAQKFISPDYERDIHDPFLFADMGRAVQRIRSAKEKKEKVLIYGDYDADGVTATVIVKEALDDLGVECDFYIPDKKKEGYAMNMDAIDRIEKQGFNLVITVDCGISNFEEIEKANEYGIDVIITDHHYVPKKIPNAFAIINPNMPNCKYPFKQLAGVGVAFKLVQAIYHDLMPEKNDQTKWFLDLVAIGTVADCVPLVGENRVLVRYGLIVISKTRRVGLRELFSAGRMLIDENNVPSSRNVAFHIAPRINAAGRVDHANLAFNLLVERRKEKAHELALEVEKANVTRQRITEEITKKVGLIASREYSGKSLIFAVHKDFPVGVIGLVAGKIAQQFNRPVAVFQKGKEQSKGSFRSIDQVNIIELIERCSENLVNYGGHSQAAGVVVKNEKMENFYRQLSTLIDKALEGLDISPQLEVDAEAEPREIDFKLIDEIARLKPFGEENPDPVFISKNMKIGEVRKVGNGDKHLKLMLKAQDGSPKVFDAIGFSLVSRFPDLKMGDKVDIAYNLERNDWNGKSKITMNLIDIKKA